MSDRTRKEADRESTEKVREAAERRPSKRRIVEGDTAVTEAVMTGTHTGVLRTPQGEIPPTGNRLNLRYVTIQQIRDGRVASEQLYFDQMELLGQLGVLDQG